MRLRLTFSKAGTLRYTGHLDLQRVWERACRRADLPLSYSRGFHPQARISMAAALPLGFLGEAELVDLFFDSDLPELEVLKRLQANLPHGLEITSIQAVDGQRPPLQTQVLSATYEVLLLDPVDPDNLATGVARLLAAASILRKRRDKEYDLRPLVEALEIMDDQQGDRVTLNMQLAASPSRTGRPEEVLAELGLEPTTARITRTALVLM